MVVGGGTYACKFWYDIPFATYRIHVDVVLELPMKYVWSGKLCKYDCNITYPGKS